MERFLSGQRVKVKQDYRGTALNAVGTVARVRSDGGAWVALDRRSGLGEKVHPFSGDDHRGTHLLAKAVDCDPAESTAEVEFDDGCKLAFGKLQGEWCLHAVSPDGTIHPLRSTSKQRRLSAVGLLPKLHDELLGMETRRLEEVEAAVVTLAALRERWQEED